MERKYRLVFFGVFAVGAGLFLWSFFPPEPAVTTQLPLLLVGMMVMMLAVFLNWERRHWQRQLQAEYETRLAKALALSKDPKAGTFKWF